MNDTLENRKYPKVTGYMVLSYLNGMKKCGILSDEKLSELAEKTQKAIRNGNFRPIRDTLQSLLESREVSDDELIESCIADLSGRV